jgi:hypothetical protein
MRIVRFCLSLVVILGLLLDSRVASTQALDINNLVVMISVVSKDGRRPWQGAGILLKQRPQVSYVVTADHVVDDDEMPGQDPSKIEVQFYDTRGSTSFPARRLYRQHDLKGLDLGIIEVHDRTSDGTVVPVPHVLTPALASSLYNGDTKDLLGKLAQTIGNGTGGAVHGWLSTDPKEIIAARDDAIEVRSSQQLAGQSGGALVESRTQSIIGLVQLASPGRGIAIPIKVVIDAVKPLVSDLDVKFNTQSQEVAVTDQLTQHGYTVNAPGLAQALAADDEQALSWYASLSFSAPIIEAALATRSRHGQNDVTAAQQYFEALRGHPRAPWLTAMLDRQPRGIDPNLRINAMGKDEAIVNVAARASSEIAVTELLRAGANPNGYQDLEAWRQSDPRFLVPFGPVLNDSSFDREAQQRIINAFLAHGAVVPAPVVPWSAGATTYGPIDFDFRQLQESMQRTFGAKLPVTPDLCSGPLPSAALAASRRLYGFDWEPLVRRIPRLFGDFQPPAKDGPDAPAFIVRYFLGADAHAAYFLVQELTDYSGYSVLEVDRELQQLALLRYSEHAYAGSRGCEGQDSVDFCWRRIALSRDASRGSYRTEYGETLAVTSDCNLAEQRARSRAAVVGPRPYTDPNPKVAQCVNAILSVPKTQLADEASHFNIFKVLTLDARQCVLAKMNADLLANPHAVSATDYVLNNARVCCAQTLGAAGH